MGPNELVFQNSVPRKKFYIARIGVSRWAVLGLVFSACFEGQRPCPFDISIM